MNKKQMQLMATTLGIDIEHYRNQRYKKYKVRPREYNRNFFLASPANPMYMELIQLQEKGYMVDEGPLQTLAFNRWRVTGAGQSAFEKHWDLYVFNKMEENVDSIRTLAGNGILNVCNL